MSKTAKTLGKRVKHNHKSALLDLDKRIVKIPETWVKWCDEGVDTKIADSVAFVAKFVFSLVGNAQTVNQIDYQRRYHLYKSGSLIAINDECKKKIQKLEEKLEKRLSKEVESDESGDLSSGSSGSD